MAIAQGNLYIDPAYVSQEAIDALGGTSSITGEPLVYGSTLADLEAGANAFIPNGMTKWFKVEGQTVYAAPGCTMYVSNYNVNNESFYSNGTYGLYFKGSSANYIYGLPKTAGTYDLENGINITLEDSLIRNSLAPGAFLSGITVIGDFNINISGSTINSLNLGGGTTYQQYGTINGNIKFNVKDTAVTNGDFHIHSGKLSNSDNTDELAVVSGTVSNVTVSGSFRGLQTDGGNDNRAMNAKFDVVITGASVNGDISIGWFNNPTEWKGSYVLTVAGSTAASIQGNASTAGEADELPDVEKFDLVLGGSEAKTVTGQIRRFKTITINAGAKVQATSISGATLVNLAQGAEVSVGQLSGIGTLAITGEYTAVSNTLFSGLESFSVGDIAEVTLNGEKIEYGFMPGQYSFMGDKLVLHEGKTVLVNSSYTDGAKVVYKDIEYTGYSSVASAQAAVSADQYILTLVPTDESSSVGADIVTKGYGVVVQGSETPIDMQGNNFMIGEDGVANAGATVIIDGLSSVGTLSFGDLDSVYVSADNVSASKVDLRGANIGDADISFNGLVVEEVYLPTANSIDGALNITSGSIETIYGSQEGDGKLALNFGSSVSVGTLYSEGKFTDVGGAAVDYYYAGLKDGGDVASIDFEATKAVKISNLVLGGDAATTIGSVNAKIGAAGIGTVQIGGDADTISGDVNIELTGPQGVAPASENFRGITYGADISGDLDGKADEIGGDAILNVTGHSKVNSIDGFDVINVTGGTLNVGQSLEGDAKITNRRTISAGGDIYASSITNTGVIGAKGALNVENSVTNSGEFRVDSLTVGGAFDNSNTIYVNGSVTVDGIFTNSGVIYSGTAEGSSFALNDKDLTNTGTIYAASLSGVKNLSTSSLFVSGNAAIDGTLTVNAYSRVAFQEGLEGYTAVTIDATSTLSVGGDSFDGSGKTLTINVGDLIGYNEVVRANGGLNDWTIKLSDTSKYGYTVSDTSIVVYSTDVVYVNSGFDANSDIIVDGNKLLYGKNAFASVEEAVAGAKAGAKIVIVNDKSGMDVNAASFDVVLDGSTVGNVTAKTLGVTSDSKANSIASATRLTIDAGAVLSVADTIPANLPIAIDASEGAGSRLALDVDATKVTLSEDQVTVIGKNTYSAKVLDGESAHAGDLYLISTDVVYFAPNKYEEIMGERQVVIDDVPQVDPETGEPIMEQYGTGVYKATFVDGDFDKATGDALFDGVNIFQSKDDAVAVATGVTGVLVIVDHMLENHFKVAGVTTAFESDMETVSGVNRSIYGGVTSDQSYTGEGDLTVMVLGTTMRGNLYAIAKKATIKEVDTYTLVIKDTTHLSNNADHCAYFVARDNGSQIDGDVFVNVSNSVFNGQATTTVGGNSTVGGDITYDISGSTFTAGLSLVTNNMNAKVSGNINAEISGSSIAGFYVGYGTFGTDETAPIDIDVKVTNSRISDFRAFRVSEDANILPVINANLNVEIYDSSVSGAFYAVYTGDWDGGSGVRLRYTAYNSGSITVTFGGVSGLDQVHGGDSLTHSRNALQNFNIPTLLHIVKGEKSETTVANWVMEWETIMVDANATFQVNNDIQYLSGDVTGRIVNDGQVALYKINMAGFEGGTRAVIRANNIYVNEDHSGIEMIGSEDIEGRYELVLVGSGNRLKQIGVYDKASDIYLNSTYASGIHGTFDGSQVLYFGYNALNDASEAESLISEWGNALVITGGTFGDIEFADALTVRAATVDSLTGSGSDDDVTITIEAKAAIGSLVVTDSAVAGDVNVTVNGALASEADIDGVRDQVAGKAKLDIKATTDLGDVTNFDEVTVAKGAEVVFSTLTNASLSVFATNTISADSITLGSDVITIDVTNYDGGPRTLIYTVNGITDFAASKVKLVAADGSTVTPDDFTVNYADGNLSIVTKKPTDIYLNSEYSAATTGTSYDGVYLEYGFNAFSTIADAVSAVGEGYSVIMTGGEFADTITLDGVPFILKEGILGMVKGGSLTVEGSATVTDGIEDISALTVDAGGTLVADHIDLLDGSSITVTANSFKTEEGNLHKVIDTVTGISGTTTFNGQGVYVFYQNNDLYVLDKSRIYVDPTYTAAITGTTAFTGDTLIFGVNAFAVPSNTNFAEATEVNNALVAGGTIFVLNWGTRGTQAGDLRVMKDVSIYTQGPTNYSIVFGNNGGDGHVVNDDIHITISNTGTPQGNTRIIHSGNDNAPWTFNGNVYITFNGTGNLNTNANFGIVARSRFNGDIVQINMDGSNGMNNDADYWIFRNIVGGAFDNVGLVEVNITGVTTPNSKWAGIFDGDPTISAKKVVLNMTDCVYRGGNWSYSMVTNGANSRATNYDVHISGTTIEGLLSGLRRRDQNVPGTGSEYSGTRTLYVDGNKISRVQQAQMFNHIVIDANAQLIVNNANNPRLGAVQFLASRTAGTSGFDDKDSIIINVSTYEGADKMLIQAPSFSYGQNASATLDDVDVIIEGDTEGKFIAGLGLTKGVYMITKNGDVLFNSSYTADDNGTAVGDTFVHMDEINPEDSNAFNVFDDAKAAFDAHEAANPGRTLFVTGNGDSAFYADGYAVTISGGTYENGVYGTDDEKDSVASVSLKITDGQFFEVAASDGNGSVTGAATIELAGGKFGIAAVYQTPEATEENPNPEPEKVEDEVSATISGSSDNVGGVSSLVVSADLTINGSIEDFDAATVNANLTVTGDFEAETITIDASKIVKVEGDIDATTIIIDATQYVGPSKVIAVSDTFETLADQPAVTILGDAETYDYKYVEDTLYLVSKHAGNVYLNSTWDESISGTIYNGELLVWGVNATNSMDEAVLKLTDDYSLFITGGNFAGTYTFSGNAKIDIRDDATTIGGLVLGDGSTITISGVTSGKSSIGSIVAVEGYTSGVNVTALSETAFGALSDIRSITVAAGQVSADSITYRENGGSLTIDFADYTAGAGVVLQTKDGISNFIQPVEGQTFSRTTVGANNNTDRLMPYYDEAKKAVVAVERGAFAFLDANASADENGTVVTIDGQTATKVYGYNYSEWNVNVGRYLISGGTLFADGGEETPFYWFFTAAPINVNVNHIRTGGFVAGYNDDSAADEKYRDGEFTAVINASTITWFAAIAGQGNNTTHQEMVVAKYDDTEEEWNDVAWNITISNGTHDTNDFRVARYANLSGGTVNVTFSDYLLRGDLMLFDRVFNGKAEGHDGDELKEVNVTLTNVQEPAAKWIQVWEPQESNSTKINLTITNMNMAGDNTSTIGLFGVDTTGSWNGEADVYITGLTNTQGNLNGGRGQTGGGLDNIDGVRRLHVYGTENNIATIREFTSIEVADGALLRANNISVSEGEGFILRGEAGYKGDAKVYVVAGTTISGNTEAQFLDANDEEIEGYAAVVGNTTAFVYYTEGDVYFNNTFSDATTGTAVVEASGITNFLVYGDNAVSGMQAASAAMDARDDATIYVLGAASSNFETRGYRIVFNSGRATTIWGGFNGTAEEVQETVSSADITVNSGATVTNIYAAGAQAMVSGDVNITIGEGTSIAGIIDGAQNFVAGDRFLTFKGSATVKGDVLGFSKVSVDADEVVAVGGTVSNAAIVIDATGFKNSSKIVMSSEAGFDDSVTVSVIGEGFSYEFTEDKKSLLVVSPFVGDTFFNTDWTPDDVAGLFVGGVELVWNKNAFNTLAGAAGAVGAGYSVVMDGGTTSESADLAGHDFVSGGTAASSVGNVSSTGATLTVSNDLTASGLAGFAAIDLTAGKTLTVSGGIDLAANAAINIDVTGYTQTADDVVLIATGTGIANIDTATISVVGKNETPFLVYYDAEDKSVHMKNVDKFYVDVAYGTAGENIQPGQTDPTTGEALVFGVNAFYSFADASSKMKAGQTIYVYNIEGDANTQNKMASMYIANSVANNVSCGFTSGDQSFVGDVSLTIVNSTFATVDGDYLMGNVTDGEPWNHQNRIFGNVTLEVTGSTMGVPNTGGNMTRVYHYTQVYGTAENPALVTMSFKDTVISNDILFIGDSPIGKTTEIDGQTYTGADLVINLENVDVPAAKWWRIQDGDQESKGTISVNIKGSTFASQSGTMRLALDNNWGTGWGAIPRSSSDFVFTVEDSVINGYLIAGRLDYGRDDAELADTYTGAKTLTVVGDVKITNTLWFRELNLTADSNFTGTTLRMATAGSTINVDITGYTGKSKVLVSMTNAFENFDKATINVVKDEGSNVDILASDRAIVIKGEVKDVYANSTYTAAVTGTVYEPTGELLLFTANAFDKMADAITAVAADGTIYVTGGSLEVATALPTNSITIDAGANLTYKGGVAITITDAFVNEGTLTMSTDGFDLSSGKTLALSAGSISGTGNYKVIGDTRYLLQKDGNAYYFVERKLDVYVNTSWSDLEDGTVVTLLSGGTATIGTDAFASGDAALANVFGGGSITIEAGDIAFSSKVTCTVNALTGVNVSTTIIDDQGVLTVSEGASAANMTVRKGGTLTVDAGALLTGTLALGNGSTATVNGTFDFNLAGIAAGNEAIVNNIAGIGGAPTYTITVDATQADGTYTLAGGASTFAITGGIVVKTTSAEIGTLTTLGKTENFGGILYTLGITDNGDLALTREVYIAPIEVTYVNSEWAGLAADTIVQVAGGTAKIGYDAFATGDEGIAAVVDYGKVEVVGGTVSFTDAIAKTIVINNDATLVGNATFATAITVTGTVAFDTAFASTEAAQFGGFSFVGGETKYTLTDAAGVIGDYKLASDVTAFTGSISFADGALTVGGDAVVVDDLAYTVAIVGTDLVLSVAEYVPPVVVPTQAYVNSEWVSYAEGTVVPVTGGTAVIGYDAFADLASAITGTTDDGKINVVGGYITFASGYSKTITVESAATVIGSANFDKPITIDGTINFSTAFATAAEAQFKNFSNVTTSASTSYVLTDTNPTAGTFLLASNAATFNSNVELNVGEAWYTLTVGADAIQVGDFTYALGITANSELAVTVAAYVPPTPPSDYIAKGDRDGNGISDVMFVWTDAWWISPEWDNLGSYDMSGDGKADAVMFGNVTTDAGIKGAYIGYYQDGDDANGWVTIGYLDNVDDVNWQNKVGNLTGNAEGKNSIVWYAPDLYAIGVWTEGTTDWVPLSESFGGEAWNLAGCGDFDGDGKDSVLMSYNASQYYTVDFDGTVKSMGSNAWYNCAVRAIGDFSGDGKEDIVLFDENTGSMYMLVDGNADNYLSIGQLDPTDWFVAGCGDYNNDQKDELLVRQYSTGMLGYYNNGVQSDANWNILGYGVGMEWTVIA